jgi:hypothetical protein
MGRPVEFNRPRALWRLMAEPSSGSWSCQGGPRGSGGRGRLACGSRRPALRGNCGRLLAPALGSADPAPDRLTQGDGGHQPLGDLKNEVPSSNTGRSGGPQVRASGNTFPFFHPLSKPFPHVPILPPSLLLRPSRCDPRRTRLASPPAPLASQRPPCGATDVEPALSPAPGGRPRTSRTG